MMTSLFCTLYYSIYIVLILFWYSLSLIYPTIKCDPLVLLERFLYRKFHSGFIELPISVRFYLLTLVPFYDSRPPRQSRLQLLDLSSHRRPSPLRSLPHFTRDPRTKTLEIIGFIPQTQIRFTITYVNLPRHYTVRSKLKVEVSSKWYTEPHLN